MATESSAIFNYFSQLSKDIAIGGNVSDLSSIRGQIGNIINALSITDFNDVTNSGIYMLMNSVVTSAANKPPTTNGGQLIVYSYQNGKYIRQIFFVYNNNLIYSRYYTGSAWGDWSELITSRGGTMEENSNLIVHTKTQTNNDPVYAGFAIRGIDVNNTLRDLYPFAYIPGNNYGTGLVINTNGLLVLGSGEPPLTIARNLVQNEELSGEAKRLYLTSDGTIYLLHGQNNGYDINKSVIINGTTGKTQIGGTDPDIILKNINIQKGEIPTINQFTTLAFSDKKGTENVDHFSILESGVRTDGSIDLKLAVFPNEEANNTFVSMGLKMNPDKTSYAWCPTPSENSNNNNIATTEWVRNYTPTSANQLTTARSIDGVNFTGEENVVHYTTCSTAAATAAKTVTLKNFVLSSGAKVYVKFTIANTASNPTLNVSGTGAKAIRFNNANIPASYLKIGLYEFIYDGTYWNFIGGGGGSNTENGNTTLNNNFNNLINPGRFFVSSTKGTTKNAPIDVTAEWWVDVSVYGSETNRRILQEARMHTTTTSSATSGPSHVLVRCCSNTTWGPWQYSYSQFAG